MTVEELRRYLDELPDDMRVLFYDAEADSFDTPHLALMPILTDETDDGPYYEVDERGERTLVILQEPLEDEPEDEDDELPEDEE